MTTFGACCTGLLTLGFAAACGGDSPSHEVLAPGAMSDGTLASSSFGGNDEGFNDKRKIVLRDDCDPRDPAWAPVGCLQRSGDVTFDEFTRENISPLAASVVGHQAWRIDPSYAKVVSEKKIRVRNDGGRPHTFTKVAQFGGGKIPSDNLNHGLVTAPECPTSTNIPPGGSAEVSGLTVGNNRFQCCIHPWMRAIIKVKAHGDHDD